jgi:transcriptional regulator with XRE-family HTH domain
VINYVRNEVQIDFNPDVPSLKQLRERLGLTQEEFGNALGIARNTISRYESGRHKQIKFSIAQVKRLVELMEQAGISVKDLPDDIN